MTRFGIDASSIGFVEAHGTGTRLGDPIEYDALASIYASPSTPRGACFLGSVKSNLGHATTAAGITSLVKVMGALKSERRAADLARRLRQSGHPSRRRARSASTPKPEPWAAEHGPRRAAISSFGFSGTNAHVVVEEAPSQAADADAVPAHLVVLSARTPDQLRQQAERLVNHLARANRPLLARCRLHAADRPPSHLPHRLAFVARDADDLVSRLSAWLAGGDPSSGVKASWTRDAGVAQSRTPQASIEAT